MTPGAQNFTSCCVEALNAFSLNGDLSTSDVAVSSAFLQNGSQYPCGATWRGDRKGAPSVKVSYTWCNQQCPGWELSSSQKLNEWLQPFVGFILPAVIFTLNVPRRRKLSLPDFVFPADITKNPVTFIVACCCALTAAIIVAIDTVLWLCAVFALAGPLLISGLYEAWIDKRVLDFVSEKIENEHLELPTRVRILLTVLVGNLDLDFAWVPTMEVAGPLESQRFTMASTRPPPTSHYTKSEQTPLNAPTIPAELDWRTHLASPMATVAENPREGVDAISATTSETLATDHDNAEPAKAAAVPTAAVSQEAIQDVKTRLKSMLACQYSFGSTIGAPVVFYIGSFIYAVSEVRSLLGDNATSHALAFGMWWMRYVSRIISDSVLDLFEILFFHPLVVNPRSKLVNIPDYTANSIPHISIVSGCLLAGNNPNTLAGITLPRETPEKISTEGGFWSTTRKALFKVTDQAIGLTYDAKYKPAWMWNRGRSKREWLLRLCEEYNCHDRHDFLPALKREISMGWLDWLTVSIFAFLLFFIPCLFGFLTSFYTPQIGLSCRSLTFLMYGCAQTWLLLLWIWNLTWRDESWRARRRGLAVYPSSKNETVQMSTLTATSLLSKPEHGTAVVIHADGARIEHGAQLSPVQQPGSLSPTTNDERVASTEQPSQSSVREIFSGLSEASWIRRSSNKRTSSDTKRRGSAATLLSSPRISRLGFVIFWLLMALGFGAAVFSAIGGTMMQVMGVYRNCLCQINVNTWLHGRNDANLQLSSNSAEDIEQALKYWIPMGVTASLFLGVVTYVAWWYQRRLRFRFTELVGRVDEKLPQVVP